MELTKEQLVIVKESLKQRFNQIEDLGIYADRFRVTQRVCREVIAEIDRELLRKE